MDAVSTVSHNISDTHVYDDFIDIAWLTGGVAFDISLVTEDVTPFETLMFIWGTPGKLYVFILATIGTLEFTYVVFIGNFPISNIRLSAVDFRSQIMIVD